MTAQREAEQVTTVEVEWDGHAYAVAASLDLVDIDTLEQMVDGTSLAFVRALLGPEQWTLLKERGRGKPHRFAEFAAVIGGAMGGSTGESSASSD